MSQTPRGRGDQRGALRGSLVVTERDSGGGKKDLGPLLTPTRVCTHMCAHVIHALPLETLED